MFLSLLAGWALYAFGGAQAQRRQESRTRELAMQEMAEMQPFLEKKQGKVDWGP